MAYDASAHKAKAQQLKQELDDAIAIARLNQHRAWSAERGYEIPAWIIKAARQAEQRLN